MIQSSDPEFENDDNSQDEIIKVNEILKFLFAVFKNHKTRNNEIIKVIISNISPFLKATKNA